MNKKWRTHNYIITLYAALGIETTVESIRKYQIEKIPKESTK
jgi:hypothetical protein